MYARLQCTGGPPPEIANAPDMQQKVVGVISSHPGFAGLYMLDQIGIGRRVLLTLWETRDEAVGASARTRGELGPRPFELEVDEIYEVIDDWSGPAAAEPAGAASFMQFETPMSQARFEAGQRAATERIQPTVAEVPGAGRVVTLWDAERRALVVFAFATSMDALDASGRAANSTELPPGEDPALLTGPTRYDVCAVVASEPAPAAAR
ncbi:MAG TPA: hypothetical protein VGL39_19270 [Jatrophihabitantaceae bacterium]